MPSDSFEETVFEALTGDTEAAGGLGPAEQAAEPGNFLRHAGALSLSKVADGLVDPKLVLSWLLTHLGAGAFWVGLLVPIREAGALLPQLFTAPRIRAMSRRKWAWAAGAAVQGLAAGAILLAALGLSGAAAGAAVSAALAVLALARSVCSVSYKDVLGRTIGKSRRGSATGLAASAASTAVVVFAVALILGAAAREALVLGAIALAALAWLGAAAIFATLREPADPGKVEGGALGQLSLLREDPQLGRFVAARGLLTATALAPPYLVILGGDAFGQLGALVLASAAAALLSSYVWGRMADRSSRGVLRRAGGLGAVALAGALLVDMAGLAGSWWALPAILFVLMIAYHGVRQGRSTYLVDMAPEGMKAPYTAASNTVIGVALLASGAFGALASLAGAAATLAVFALMCLAAIVVAGGLEEVEEP